MSCVREKQRSVFRPGPTQNEAVQLMKIARGLKFRIKKVNGLYYLCSENKDADQLRGYREADLRLCFSHIQTLVFSLCGLYMGGWPSWSCDQDALNKLSFPLRKKAPHKILL